MDYALTIDGLPYYATTGTLPVTLWNELNDEDEPLGATALTALEMPRGSWSERMRLVDGDLEVGGMTFELHDVTPSTGIAAGQPWLTWLASRQPIEIDSAVLAGSMTAAATTFVLTSSSAGAISGSIPCVLWVDDEAIDCSSYNGGTYTVTVAGAAGRGYYGTRARAHAYDAETSVVPEAWVAPPWINRRRVLLWRIDATTGTATVMWRGYANRPRLSPNGASWQLQCEPAWTVDRARPLGTPATSMRVRGYSPVAVQFGARVDGAEAITTVGTSFRSTASYDALVFTTIDQLIAWSAAKLARDLAAGTGATSITAAQVDIQRLGASRRVRMRVNTTGAVNDTMMAVVRVFREDTEGSVAKKNPQFSEVEVDLPSAAIVLPNVYTSSSLPRIPLTSVAGLAATTASPAPYTDGPHSATAHTALLGDAGDDRRLVLLPESSDANDGTIGGPAIRARWRYVDAITGRTIAAPFGRKLTPIDSAVTLTLGSVVNTTHWALGLRAIINDTDHVKAGLDARNFDTDTLSATARITESDLSARRWLLSGDVTFGDIAIGTLAIEGCCPAIRGDGKVGFVAVRAPTPTETVTATFTNASFVVGERALWEDAPSGIVGTAAVEIGKSKVTVNDTRTIGRYGQGRVPSFKVIGLDYSGDVTDARLVASRALSRVVQVFGEPAPVVKWTTPLATFIDAAYCGDIVAVTDATTPSGTGTRGNTLRRCQVIAREINLARGTIAWEALALPVAYGYAPCVRVASISGAVVTADYQYVLEGGGSATDYAGTTTGAAGNRGVTKFVAGDKVKLLLRNSTTYTDEPLTVLSVNGGSGTITMTASVPTVPTDWVTLAGSGMVDLVYDGYETASIQTAQKSYAVVGNNNAVWGGIGSSGDKSRRWGA